MSPGRLNALTDGVVAIVLTIMVLEVKIPAEPTPEAVLAVLPFLAAYLLAFVYVAIYWNSHHHMMHAVAHVNGAVMWANLHVLFWLSLFPFTTSWLAESQPLPAPVPTALYGFVLLMASLAWIPLSRTLIAANGGLQGKLAKATGGKRDWKAMVSPPVYLAAIVLAFFAPILSCVLYAVVAAIWFIPDRRIEKKIVKS